MNTAPFIPTRDLVVFPGVITPIFVGRDKSIKSLEKSMMENNILVLAMQKDINSENPKLPDDIYGIGVLVNVMQTLKMPNNSIKVLVEVKSRVKINTVGTKEQYYFCEYEELKVEEEENEETEAIRRKVINKFEKYGKVTNKIAPDLVISLRGINSINKVFDLISANLLISNHQKQEILEVIDLEKRGYKLLEIINKEIEIHDLERKIDNKVKNQMNNTQKSYYIKEKIKVLKEELGEENQSTDEEELRAKVNEAKIPKNVKEKLEIELKKLSKMPPFSSEASVIRSYIETIIDLPWNKVSKETLDIKKASDILEEDHYGLEKVKERILEFLAVKKLNKSLKGSIICLVGPPGVGKTSLAQSIARAVNRKFVRISLGGVRDEAEIRGHRRTYIGSMPGRIIKALKIADSKNPLMLLDEIDKMSTDFRGDPSSAMLEVLDPEQNKNFEDHYVDMPFDLSNVFFIATANDLKTIPVPLIDRMEIISLSSYTEFEKLNIAKKYLLKEAQNENGLSDYEIKFSDEALFNLINEYTREAGVRNLKREINKVFRKIAKEVIEKDKKKILINVKNLKKYLGNPIFRPDKLKEKEAKIGIVNGLAWTSVGGTTLEVQTVKMEGKGKLTLTGKLGEVMKESAQVAFSYIRSMREHFEIEEKFEEKYDLHLHFPEGAVPKDGPSAGITITSAIVSILANKKVRQDIAMTGEITITGEVLAVGGIKEKVIGAHRVGIREVILPIDNEPDTEELPLEITKDMKFFFAKTYEDVEELIFQK